MLKKIISITMLIILVAMSTVAFAANNEKNIGLQGWDEIKWNKENIIEPYGTKKPTEVWDITDLGIYNFAGQAGYQDLYTEYLITGKTSYTVEVENKRDYTLTMEVYKKAFIGILDSKIATKTAVANDTSTFTISGLKTGDKIYIKYISPVYCEGTIK